MNAPATAAADTAAGSAASSTGGSTSSSTTNSVLARAEAHGRQLLLYAAEGPLGGSFLCFRCGAQALQPVLLQHARSCPYHPSEGSAGQ